MGHKLDDDRLITPTLLRFVINETRRDSRSEDHFLVMKKSDGSFLEHNPGAPELDEMQAVFARDILNRLNNELAHDGAWVMWFAAPGRLAHLLQSRVEYGQFTLLWIDKDGDPQTCITWENGETDELDFADVLLSGIESWAERCEQAWQMWHTLSVEMLDAQQGQTYKAALGEAKPSLQ